MMKYYNSQYYISILLAAGLLAGCASNRKMATSSQPSAVRVEPVKALLPDASQTVDVDVNFVVPAEALHRRSRLVIVPQWLYRDSVWAEYRPVVLDAPVYAQKLHRRTQLYGYVDSLAVQAQAVKLGQDLILPYRERVTLPAGATGGRLVAQLSSDGCGTCGVVDTLDMAYLTTVPQLLDAAAVCENWLEQPFTVRPKVMEGKGEALLQFAINSHVIDDQLGCNREELQGMRLALEPILRDSLATLHHLVIYGMASADGSLAYNTALASRRANAAKQWLMHELNLPSRMARQLQVGSRPEGWEPVLAAMQADGHPDTLRVRQLLDRYAGESDDKAEYHIRCLACWNDIKNRYLQKDRKVVYEYSYTLKSFTTDTELLAMYVRRPDAFNEEELLKVATLKTEPSEQEAVYRTVLQYFPQSTVASNNLAVLLLRRGAADEAEQVLHPFAENPTLQATRGQLFLATGRYEQALAAWQAADTASESVRYNLGMTYALLHRFSEAYTCLESFHDVNAALVSLCAGQPDHAWAQLEACPDRTPKAAYVRALAAARRGDRAAMLVQLQQTAAEPQWMNRAAGEVEFRAYWQDPDFLQLTKGGTQR